MVSESTLQRNLAALTDLDGPALLQRIMREMDEKGIK